MPVTNAARLNLFPRRILSMLALGTQLLDYLEDGVQRHTKAMTTGASPSADAGAWFEAVTLADGAGVNDITLGNCYGVDGSGNFISETAGATYITDVPFEDAAATTYYVAVSHGLVPQESATNLSDGSAEYAHHKWQVCQLAEPSAVVVSGSGLAFSLGNHKLHASDDFTARTAVIWKVDPASNSTATAIETVTIVGTTATSVGQFGQSVASTTAADYRVAILGPVITRSSSVQSLAGYAYVGTVVGGGAPRTFDDSGQNLLNTLGEVSDVFDSLLSKGWVTLPTLSGTGTDTLTNGTGVAYSNGRLHSLAGGTNGSLTVSSTLYASFDIAAGAISVYSSWDNANSGDRVPVGVLTTDGAGLITKLYSIGASVKEFNRSIELTLSSDAAHRTAFDSLPEVLAAMAAIQSGSTFTPPGFVVDVVGDVNVAATISDQALLVAERVTFRGRGSRWDGAGSRIVWTFDDSLFQVNSTTTLKGWTFEDLAFVCDVTCTDATDAVIQVTGTAIVEDLVFRRCFFDGSPSPSLTGGAGGSLPQVLYCSANPAVASVRGLVFERCEVWTTDTVVQITSAASVMSRLWVDGCVFNVEGTSAVGAVIGGIRDEAASGASADWWITDSDIYVAEGPCIVVNEGVGLRIHDCEFFSEDADTVVLDFGNAGALPILSELWIHDCKIRHNWAAGSSSSPVVRIRSANTSSRAPGIFVHSNLIVGDSATDAGILFEINGTDLDGVIVHSNAIVNCGDGVVYGTIGAGLIAGPVLNGNYIQVRDTGVHLAGAVEPIAVGNYVEATAASAFAFDVDVTALLVGNVAVLGDTTGTGVDLAAAVDEAVILATRITGSNTPIKVNGGDGNILAANVSSLSGSLVDVDTGSENTIVALNVLDDLQVDGLGSIVVGNYVADAVDYGATDVVLVANYATSITGDATTDRAIIVGNHSRTINEDSASACVLVGNWISGDAAVVTTSTNTTIVGNVWEANSFELGAASTDVVLVGNRITDQTLTDGGTNNVVANNS